MQKNTRLNTFGIYFVPRRLVEDTVPNQLKRLKRLKNKRIKNNENVDEINEQINILSSKRPCIILKQYNANVTVIPLTHSDDEVDPTNMETFVKINNKGKRSFIKTSVIVTISKDKFKEVSDQCGNLKLPRNEIEELLKRLQNHYLGVK